VPLRPDRSLARGLCYAPDRNLFLNRRVPRDPEVDQEVVINPDRLVPGREGPRAKRVQDLEAHRKAQPPTRHRQNLICKVHLLYNK